MKERELLMRIADDGRVTIVSKHLSTWEIAKMLREMGYLSCGDLYGQFGAMPRLNAPTIETMGIMGTRCTGIAQGVYWRPEQVVQIARGYATTVRAWADGIAPREA